MFHKRLSAKNLRPLRETEASIRTFDTKGSIQHAAINRHTPLPRDFIIISQGLQFLPYHHSHSNITV
jgi:hypothetical protein